MYTEKITTRQMILTMTIFRVTLVISYMPSTQLPPANQDVWVVLLLSIFYVTIMRIPLLFLANKFNDITMMEYQEKILGKFLGRLITFLYGLYFGFTAIYTILIQNKMVGVDILPRTPYWIIMLPILIISLYVGSKGLKTIFWAGDLLTPVTLISIILLLILGLQNVDFNVLLPILADSTFKEINIGAIMLSFILTDIFVLGMGVPFLENKKDINKIFLRVTIYSKLLAIIAVIVTQASLGIEQTRHSNFPFLIYTRLIQYNSAFQRIDPLYVIAWLSSNIGRIIIYIYFSYMNFNRVFNIKNRKYIFYIICITVNLIALYLSNKGVRVMIQSPFTIGNMYISAIFIIVIPLFTTIVYFFRRNSLEKAGKIEN